MAKSFLDSVKNVNNIRNLNELSQVKHEVKIENKEVEIEHKKTIVEKGKPGRKPIRRAIYIKRTIELREDHLQKLDKLAYDNRTSKREEIENAIDVYFKSIKY